MLETDPYLPAFELRLTEERNKHIIKYRDVYDEEYVWTPIFETDNELVALREFELVKHRVIGIFTLSHSDHKLALVETKEKDIIDFYRF